MVHLAYVLKLYREDSSVQDYCTQLRRSFQRLPARASQHFVCRGGSDAESGAGKAGTKRRTDGEFTPQFTLERRNCVLVIQAFARIVSLRTVNFSMRSSLTR